jgi:hypothetical protein
MLRAAKHLEDRGERSFAAAQGDTWGKLRLMRITADLSALGGYSSNRIIFETP